MLNDTQVLETYSDCIEDVMRFIREHISEPLDRETLADVAGFSVPHFHRVFTAHVGESAISYIRRVRLERAGRKLRMGAVDITEVALAAGYDSHAAFSKAFKQHFGLSPSEFRQLGCWAASKLLRKG
ncbi:MAG TPA: AraC family transcriptional regulator [Anaerolineales bacterium]|nr:AraC family transcriptional regulator [Anaerolineales bacterium]